MATFYLEDLSSRASTGLPVAGLAESLMPHVSPVEALVGLSSGYEAAAPSPTATPAPARQHFTPGPEDEAHRSALRLATVADLMAKAHYVDESLSEVDLALKGWPSQYPGASSRDLTLKARYVDESPSEVDLALKGGPRGKLHYPGASTHGRLGARRASSDSQLLSTRHSEPADEGLGPGASSPGDFAASGARTSARVLRGVAESASHPQGLLAPGAVQPVPAAAATAGVSLWRRMSLVGTQAADVVEALAGASSGSSDNNRFVLGGGGRDITKGPGGGGPGARQTFASPLAEIAAGVNGCAGNNSIVRMPHFAVGRGLGASYRA